MIVFFCTPLKVLADKSSRGISGYSRKGGANKLNAENALVCKFHFNPGDIIYPWKKQKVFKTYYGFKFS